jgi:hypothetical protein
MFYDSLYTLSEVEGEEGRSGRGCGKVTKLTLKVEQKTTRKST